MNVNDPNISVLELVVDALGSLKDELVLVGGCSIGLLITDQARPPVRQTIDVDMVTQVASITDYYKLSEKLRFCGFHEASDDANMCRWKKSTLILDVMPSDQSVLGHSTNNWYHDVVNFAELFTLPSSVDIRLVSAPVLVATKFDAFHSRGGDDYAHHDIEDIVNIIDGRPELISEGNKCSPSAWAYLREEFDELLLQEGFMDLLPGHFNYDPHSAQARADIVIDRMRKLAGL